MLSESELPLVTSKTFVPPSSPVTIESSLFDMTEIKPLVLPGTWTTVGKGGRPLRVEQKMYDPPQKKKKRQRTRLPKKDQEEEDSLAEYEEMPSSSNCLISLSQSMLKHEKAVERKHQAKHWARYRQERAMMTVARDNLAAELADKDTLDDDLEGTPVLVTLHVGTIPKQWQFSKHSNNHRVERIRRKARRDAAAARCFFEPEDDVIVNEGLPTRAAKESALLAASHSIKQVAAGSAPLTAVHGDSMTTATDVAPAKTTRANESEGTVVATSTSGRRKRDATQTNSGKNCSVM